MCVENIAQRQAVVPQSVAVYFSERRFRVRAKRSTPLSITYADLPVAKRPVRLLRSTVTAPDLLLMVTVVTPERSVETLAASLEGPRAWSTDQPLRTLDGALTVLALRTRQVYQNHTSGGHHSARSRSRWRSGSIPARCRPPPPRSPSILDLHSERRPLRDGVVIVDGLDSRARQPCSGSDTVASPTTSGVGGIPRGRPAWRA